MNKKVLPYFLIIIFILSLIPLYIIGGYAHPSVDDYYYGVETSTVWQDTGSLSQVIKESFSLMKTTYREWQGNFAAIFLMRLQPSVFGEKYYVIAPIILITAFVISMLSFIYYSMRKIFGAGRLTGLLTGIVLTFCAMQFTYRPSDSFYWYNGSIYYTFFFSLMLVMFTMVVAVIRSEHMPARIIAGIAGSLLAFIVGGGNYATALLCAIIFVTILAGLIYKKNKTWIPVLVMALFLFAAFGISIKAPGNAIRQASVGGHTGVIRALIYSFAYGAYNIADSTTFPVIIMWLGLMPVFYRVAKKTGFSFRLPGLVIAFIYCVYSAQGTPLFYAQGLRMPYRMMNIIYFSYYIFIGFALFYLLGWIGRRFEGRGFDVMMEKIYGIPKYFATFTTCIIIVFAFGLLGLVDVSEAEDGGAAFSNMPMSVSATYSLVTGEAKTYDEELNERADYLSNLDGADGFVDELSATPEVLFHSDITEDGSDWRNAHLALFYKLNSVTLIK